MSVEQVTSQHAEDRRTPLHDLHLERGARMVAFAGYQMPLQYGTGILAEHLHTRSAAGLFDVSHMGQVEVRARSGGVRDAALALEALVPVDLEALGVGRQRYGLFTNPDGGILDDLMIANLVDRLLLVVNASRKSDDVIHLSDHLSASCEITELTDRALIALQGPAAETVLTRLNPRAEQMRFLDVAEMELAGVACTVSRSGYTGEDGFEIGMPAQSALKVAEALLAHTDVAPVGLGARDSLRLEAGLCLYGSDLTPLITPVEAALEWSIQKSRRCGGVRAGGFPGASIIDAQLEKGAPRRRVGLRPEGRGPVRGAALLFAAEHASNPIGSVTSGCFGPSANAPVAMGYVDRAHSDIGVRLFAEVRGARLPIVVSDTPFVPHSYKR